MINRQNSDMNDINIEEPVTAASSIYDLACYKTMIYDWLLPTCLVWSSLVWTFLFNLSALVRSYVSEEGSPHVYRIIKSFRLSMAVKKEYQVT